MWINTLKVILGYKNASAFIPQRYIVGKIHGISIFPPFLHSLNLGSQRVKGYFKDFPDDFPHFGIPDAPS